MKNEEVVSRLNTTLIGQPGIAMLTESERPKYLGTLRNVQLKSTNILFLFSEHNVLFFSPLSLVSIVGEETKEGSFPSIHICNSLFIGDKILEEIFEEVFEG